MIKKKFQKKRKKKDIKLINPVMVFKSGLLSYDIDIPKTKKIVKWLKEKKRKTS